MKIVVFHKIHNILCIGSIFRNGNIIIPNTHTEVLSGDELLLFTKEKNITKAENLFL